jgi:hypothetical protein
MGIDRGGNKPTDRLRERRIAKAMRQVFGSKEPHGDCSLHSGMAAIFYPTIHKTHRGIKENPRGNSNPQRSEGLGILWFVDPSPQHHQAQRKTRGHLPPSTSREECFWDTRLMIPSTARSRPGGAPKSKEFPERRRFPLRRKARPALQFACGRRRRRFACCWSPNICARSRANLAA